MNLSSMACKGMEEGGGGGRREEGGGEGERTRMDTRANSQVDLRAS